MGHINQSHIHEVSVVSAIGHLEDLANWKFLLLISMMQLLRDGEFVLMSSKKLMLHSLYGGIVLIGTTYNLGGTSIIRVYNPLLIE